MQSSTRTCRRLFTSDFSIFFGATDSSSLRCWSRYSSRCDFIAFSWNVVGGMCQEIVAHLRAKIWGRKKLEAPGCQAAAASASGTAAGEVAAGLLAGGAAGEPAGCDLRLKFWSSRSCIICTFYRATASTSGKERTCRWKSWSCWPSAVIAASVDTEAKFDSTKL